MSSALHTAEACPARVREVLPPWASFASSVLAATPDRSGQFAAGRACAAAALAGLGTFVSPARIVRGPHGEPVWPHGFCGSITHSGPYVAAAAARLTDAAGIGIDAIEIVAPARAARVSSVVARPAELQRLRRAGMDEATALTLAFSAKESLFKCLFPAVRRYFDFLDAEVVRVDVEAAWLEFFVSPSIGWRSPASALNARFTISGRFVHTGVWVSAE
jgi:4'-phosphopantetheinyl transferase EntD